MKHGYFSWVTGAAVGVAGLAGFTACDQRKTVSGGAAPGAGRDAPLAAIVESTRWPQVGSDLKPDANARFGALPNGLRFIILPNSEPPGRASLRLYIDTGSLQETDEERGLAHFLEHMAFNGTKNFPAGQMVEYFQRLGMAFGADTNAHTSFRETVYKLELPPGADGKAPDAQTLLDGLKMLRDVGDGMLLDPKEIDKERGIILSEKLARDTVESRTMEEGLKFQLPDSKISQRLPIGTEDVITNAPAERLKDYYRKYYTPDRMVLVVVGAVDPPALEKEVAAIFGPMAPGVKTPDPAFGTVTVGRGIATKAHMEKESGQATASFAVVQPYQPKVDSSAERLQELKAELASRMIGRRFDVLSKEKDSPLLQGQAQLGPFLRLLEFSELEVTAPPPRWADAVALGARELKKAMTYGFTQSELADARAEILAELENEVKSASTRKSKALADEIVRALGTEKVFTDPVAEFPRIKAALEKITAEECHQVFKKAFGSKDLTIFAAGNLPPSPTGESLEAALQRGMGEKIDPPVEQAQLTFGYTDFGSAGAVAESQEVADLGVTMLSFKNGVRANLKPTTFKKDEVLVQVSFGTGKLSLPPNQPGLELFTRRVFELGGLGKHSVDDLKRVLSGKTATVSFDVAEDVFALVGETTREDLGLQLQLLCAYLSDPGWREEADQLFRQGADALFAQVDHALEAQPQTKIEPFLRGGDYRFAFPTKEEALARTLAEAKAWMTPPLTRGNVEIGIVGDFDPSQATQQLATTFGALPPRAGETTPTPEALTFPPPGRKDFVFQSKIAKGLVASHFPTTDRSDIQRTRRLQVLASVFSDKLREKIREELGESYSPRASAVASDVFPGFGYIFANILVTPSQAPKVSSAVSAIAAKLRQDGATADDVDRAIKPLLTAIEEQRRSNAYWLTNVCAMCQRDPRRLEWTRTMIADFKAVTEADLDALSKEFLDPAAIREVRIIPAP